MDEVERKALDSSRLKELLEYDEDTGVFVWLQTRRVKAGSVAGCADKNGYWRIWIDQREYLAHRLAWLYVHGEWPKDQIDHRDGNRSNNRICNLRECSMAQNNQNALRKPGIGSPYTGVRWAKNRQAWEAKIGFSGVSKHLGYFSDPEAARDAYLAAKSNHHEFQPVPRDAAAPSPEAQS